MNRKESLKILFIFFIMLLFGDLFLLFISFKPKDITAPNVEVKNLEIYDYEELPKAQDFITKITESSDYKIKEIFPEKKLGNQNIEIMVEDKYGNITKKTVVLTIKEYELSPIFIGLTPITIEIGESLYLKKDVKLLDKKEGNISFLVDDTQVNYNKPGEYKIIYKAKNINFAKERTITIKESSKSYMLKNFSTYNQYPNYPNGCESIALYNILKYYNINVKPDEIVARLKKGSGIYQENGNIYGGNPEIEFVGNPKAYNGYGVYETPIQEVGNYYKPA